MDTIFDYATADEIAAIRAKAEDYEAAGTALAKMQETYNRVSLDLRTSAALTFVDYRAAAQRAMGSDVVEAPVAAPMVNRAELQRQQTGLAQLIADQREAVAVAKGRLRGATADLLKTCADRLGADYLKAAQTLGWCHAQLVAASRVVNSPSGFLVSEWDWQKLHIPGADNLPTLKAKTRDEYGSRVLMTGHGLMAETDRVFRQLPTAGREVLGTWVL